MYLKKKVRYMEMRRNITRSSRRPTLEANNFGEHSEETTYKSKHSLWNKVKGGEKVEQPHGGEDRHPEEKLDVYLKILPATLPWCKVIGQG